MMAQNSSWAMSLVARSGVGDLNVLEDSQGWCFLSRVCWTAAAPKSDVRPCPFWASDKQLAPPSGVSQPLHSLTSYSRSLPSPPMTILRMFLCGSLLSKQHS